MSGRFYAQIWTSRGAQAEHRALIWAVLGRPLRETAPIHHVNGDKKDNRHQNLVVCQDDAYHKLLHVRVRAKLACGHANWRRCRYCRKWDAPERLGKYVRGSEAYHLACLRADHRRRWKQGGNARRKERRRLRLAGHDTKQG